MNNLTFNENQLYHTLHSQWRRCVNGYENEEFHKAARDAIPIVQLTCNAQKKFLNRQGDQSNYSIKEFLFLELLRWFKLEFFQWVDTLKCWVCGGKTSHGGPLTPNSEEVQYGAFRVENHYCQKCQVPTRFPRYNCPKRLLTWRKGRCGEWANCFVLCSRALGFETRYVLDETDHVWAEVFCENLGSRWVHADPCENRFDKPLLYEKGWKKKLSYIFAFSAQQVLDVSWRYSQDHQGLKTRRIKYRESIVAKLIANLNRKIRRESINVDWECLSKRLISEYIEFLNNDVKLNPSLCNTTATVQREVQGRTTGSVEWRKQRGELGDSQTANVGDATCSAAKEGFTFVINSINNYSSTVGERTFVVKYCPVDDVYISKGTGGNTSEIMCWNKGAHSYSNIHRKEEFDWKMVYLCRDPNNDSSTVGKISWKFSIDGGSGGSEHVFKFIKLRFVGKTYENGCIQLTVESTSKKEQRKHLDTSQEMHDVQISDWATSSIIVSVELSGGTGDVAWQHTQLFRQSLTQPANFPFEITLFY